MSSHARERETKKKVTFNANHMNIREKKIIIMKVAFNPNMHENYIQIKKEK